MSRVVYVVQEPKPTVSRKKTDGNRPGIDISSAEIFGELRYIFEWSETQDVAAMDMLGIVKRRMEEFKMGDLILMIGNPTAMALAVLTASRMAPTFSLLYWDRDNRQYVEVFIDMEAWNEEMEIRLL